MITTTIEEQSEEESWDTWEFRKKYWPPNKIILEKRIGEVNKKYDELVVLAGDNRCFNSSTM